jgi:anti-anti-sigma factor
MAEYAVDESSDTRVPCARAPYQPLAEEHHLDRPLRITEYGNHGAAGLRVAGEIDLNSHRAWKQALRRMAGRSDEILLDLSELTFIDVRGTAVLMDLAELLPDGHRIVVRNAPPGLLRVMQVLWPDGASAIIFKGDQ